LYLYYGMGYFFEHDHDFIKKLNTVNTDLWVNLIEAEMYVRHGYVDMVSSKLLETANCVDVHVARLRIKIEEDLLPHKDHMFLGARHLLKFLKLYLQDHIITAPKESEDYQVLLTMLKNIAEQTPATLQEQVDMWKAKEDNDGVIACYLEDIRAFMLGTKEMELCGMFSNSNNNSSENKNTNPDTYAFSKK